MLAQLFLAAVLSTQAPAQLTPAVKPLPFRVIVHNSNAVNTLTRDQVSLIFLKRLTQWPDQTEILPVDQSATSRARERFSRTIHRKSVAYVTRYWHRLIFSGRGVPPVELVSSSAVLEFVKANRGAIGYIDSNLPLDPQVKEIGVRP